MHFRQNRKANQHIGRGHSRSWFVALEVSFPFTPSSLILNAVFADYMLFVFSDAYLVLLLEFDRTGFTTMEKARVLRIHHGLRM